MDKYGTDQDPYCYPGTSTLRNLIDIRDDATLQAAERDLSALAADSIQFSPPPYRLPYLQHLHYLLFGDLYSWAGEIRTIDIAKGETRFCHVPRIIPEANKLFDRLMKQAYFAGLPRVQLVNSVSELYGDMNVLHPFREGNGRAQRLLFEHLIIHCGFEISWLDIAPSDWLQANINAYHGDYRAMTRIFDVCIGSIIRE